MLRGHRPGSDTIGGYTWSASIQTVVSDGSRSSVTGPDASTRRPDGIAMVSELMLVTQRSPVPRSKATTSVPRSSMRIFESPVNTSRRSAIERQHRVVVVGLRRSRELGEHRLLR